MAANSLPWQQRSYREKTTNLSWSWMHSSLGRWRTNEQKSFPVFSSIVFGRWQSKRKRNGWFVTRFFNWGGFF